MALGVCPRINPFGDNNLCQFLIWQYTIFSEISTMDASASRRKSLAGFSCFSDSLLERFPLGLRTREGLCQRPPPTPPSQGGEKEGHAPSPFPPFSHFFGGINLTSLESGSIETKAVYKRCVKQNMAVVAFRALSPCASPARKNSGFSYYL